MSLGNGDFSRKLPEKRLKPLLQFSHCELLALDREVNRPGPKRGKIASGFSAQPGLAVGLCQLEMALIQAQA